MHKEAVVYGDGGLSGTFYEHPRMGDGTGPSESFLRPH